MSPTEYRLLVELSVNAVSVLTFDYLLEGVWRLKKAGTRRNLRSYVKRLRHRLGDRADSPGTSSPSPASATGWANRRHRRRTGRRSPGTAWRGRSSYGFPNGGCQMHSAKLNNPTDYTANWNLM